MPRDKKQREKVLLADNNRKDLRFWAKELRAAGYDVQEASSELIARKHLDQGGFDLAVVDLHLREDDSEEDDSGLQIAEKYGRSLPIVIFSGKPTYKLQRKSLRGRKPPAADFVNKADGSGVLVDAVRAAILPKIFVSHGKDDLATTAVIKFLEDEGAKPVDLSKEIKANQSILDAFEQSSKVAFAIILVTPDDEGYLKGESPQARARQNVIFELGFFLGRLGRERVLVLHKKEDEPFEWPSNFRGLLYREMDRGGLWRAEVRRDLIKAGVGLG